MPAFTSPGFGGRTSPMLRICGDEEGHVEIESMVTKGARAGKVYDLEHIHTVWEDRRLRRLMGNEVVYPPSPKAVKAIVEYANWANYYPEDASTCARLRGRLAEYVGIKDGADWITLGNGSLEIMDLLYRVFLSEGDDILLPSPDYSPYARRACLFGSRIVDVIPGAGFSYRIEDFIRALTRQTKLIILSRPNNPTGNMVSRKVIEDLCATERIVLVDEAYAQFAGESVCDMVASHRNLVVSRTFSKAMGLAGIRLGFVVTTPEIVGYLNRVRVPMNVSLLAMVAALAALEDQPYIEEITGRVVEARNAFFDALAGIPGIKPFPSAGNFVLMNCAATGKPASAFCECLMANGYSVRLFANARGLPGDQYFRVTIGTRDDMVAIAEVIHQLATSG
jgi:histidinol-phosphate aminotransferase